MSSGYPILLLLEGKLAVVVGGGRVAERKIRSLLGAGGRVRVIAPEVTEPLRLLAECGQVELVQREYESGDLEGAFLVIASTDDEDVNAVVWEEARERNVLINTVDVPPLCNFYVPAVVRRGGLTVSISTHGKSPALAARIRQRLEKTFGPEYEHLLELLNELRQTLIERVDDPQERKRLCYELVDADLLVAMAEEGVHAARARGEALLDDALAEGVA